MQFSVPRCWLQLPYTSNLFLEHTWSLPFSTTKLSHSSACLWVSSQCQGWRLSPLLYWALKCSRWVGSVISVVSFPQLCYQVVCHKGSRSQELCHTYKQRVASKHQNSHTNLFHRFMELSFLNSSITPCPKLQSEVEEITPRQERQDSLSILLEFSSKYLNTWSKGGLRACVPFEKV